MRDDTRFNKEKSFSKSRFSGKDTGRPTMHKATCSKCGKTCEVPFKPNGDKPIFCNDCFDSKKNYEGNERKPFERNSNDREMFAAVCDECKKSCRVPFKPSNNKPVYCSDCFEGKENDSHGDNRNVNLKQELDAIKIRLDEIVRLLRK